MQKKYQWVIVGGGTGAREAAAEAAQLGLKTALVEHKKKEIAPILRLPQLSRYQTLDDPKYSLDRLRSLGVDVLVGAFRFANAKTITNGIDVHRAKRFLIATGKHPHVPQIPWMEQVAPITLENISELTTIPKQLLIWGGGSLGCELAQTFAQIGSQVTLLEESSQLLPGEDWEVARLIHQRFLAEGIQIHLNAKPIRVQKIGDVTHLDIKQNNREQTLDTEQLFVATGLRPNIAGWDLDRAGIQHTPSEITVDATLKTSVSHIYASSNAMEAKLALHNAFFPFAKKVSVRLTPHCTFTNPEIAQIGLNETEAKAKNIPYDLYTYPINDLPHARHDPEACGFLKVLTPQKSDQILGATLVGNSASLLIHEMGLAMQHRLGLKKIAKLVHVSPTLSEGVTQLAEQWAQTRLTQPMQRIMQKYFELFF